MKKTITILFALLLLMPITMAFNMTINPNMITLNPGENYNFNITFQSNESINITNLERNDTENTISSYFSKTSFELNGTEKVEVLIVLPNTITEGNHTLIFKAKDNNNNTNTSNITITIPPQNVHTNTGFHFGYSDITLGGPNQERDTTINGYIEVYNDQNNTINNFNIQYNINSKYQFTFTSTIPTTINPYEKFNITYTAYIPKETDSQKTKIGEISFTSNITNGSRKVYVQAKNKLEFTDIDFTSDDGDDSNLNDGDTINVNLKPESKAEFEIDLKNYFTNTEDININDAYIKMTIENIDDGDDITEKTERKDIRPNKKKTYNLQFTIPETAEEGDYNVILEAFGEDENGAEHYSKVELTLKVKREKHDLRIKNININPTVACIGDKITIKTTLKNEGTRDEDRTTIIVEQKELNYKKYETFSLDSYDGSHNQETAVFYLDTKNIKPGEYTLQFKAYYDDNFINYNETKIYIEDCNKKTENTQKNESKKPAVVIVEQKPNSELTGTNNKNTIQENSKQKTETKNRDKTIYWLIAANILLIIIVIIVIIILLK